MIYRSKTDISIIVDIMSNIIDIEYIEDISTNISDIFIYDQNRAKLSIKKNNVLISQSNLLQNRECTSHYIHVRMKTKVRVKKLLELL